MAGYKEHHYERVHYPFSGCVSCQGSLNTCRNAVNAANLKGWLHDTVNTGPGSCRRRLFEGPFYSVFRRRMYTNKESKQLLRWLESTIQVISLPQFTKLQASLGG